jgi:hypothetical protein
MSKGRENAHTWLLKANDIRHIGHVDATFQLQTWLAPDSCGRLILAHHQLRFLLVWVDILAAE